jgi:hypothetical protein
MPGDPGALVVTNARAFYTTRAAAGATGTRHSPLPFGGERFLHNSGASRGESADLYLELRGDVIASASEAIQSLLPASGLLRFAGKYGWDFAH